MKDPDDVVNLWERAWNDADAGAIADLFADDADFVNVVGLWWHDKASIQDAHAFGFAKMFPDSKMTMAKPHVRHIGNEAAVVQCQWHMVGQISPIGVPAGEREGVFTFVLERRTGGWITVAAQNTDIQPGAQTHINSPDGYHSTRYGRRVENWAGPQKQ